MKSTMYIGLLVVALAIGGTVSNAEVVNSQSTEAAYGQETVTYCITDKYNVDNCRLAWDNADKSAYCPAGEEAKLDHCSVVSNAPRCRNGNQEGQDCYCRYTCKKTVNAADVSNNNGNVVAPLLH